MKSLLLLLVAFFTAGCCMHRSQMRMERFPMREAAIIVVHNPYSAGVDIELKCGTRADIRHVPGKGAAVLRIPAGAVRCDAWPKIRLW
jgi:hypothetical protein